ncbi:hypothetical protein GW756_03395 [bacterium]|nr:hypothetical protein [bacterium]NCQ55437.1 hypothetical protein [Candidatus Parcubacteria bacterium]NCS67799.1 hypothetical protein [Candidatus Peregrinibacteria bacterium]NCS96387.1 hypothetical protein [bacterium]
MFNALWHKLKVSEYEAPKVTYLWSLRCLYQIGFIFVWTVLTAIFLEMFGIGNLLFLFLVEAWILLIGSYLAHFLFLRIHPNQFMIGCIVGTLICALASLYFYDRVVWFMVFAILGKDLFYGQLNIALARKNESALSPKEAQRLMPILDSAVTIGTVLAAALFLGLIEFFPTKLLLTFWLVPLVAMLGLVLQSKRWLYEMPSVCDLEKEETKNSLEEAMEAVKNIPFLRYLSVLVCVQSALYAVIDFEFLKYIKNKAVKKEWHFDPHNLQANMFENVPGLDKVGQAVDTAALYADKALEVSSKYFVQTSIAAELGFLALVFGIIALIVQFGLASQILKRSGLIYSMLVYFGGLLAMLAAFFTGGVSMKFVRGYQHGFEAIFESAYHMTFYSVFSHHRESIRHFFEGFVRPGGVIVGVGLMISMQFLADNSGVWLMSALTVGLMLMLLPMRHFYTKLSHQNLQSPQNIAAKMHSIEVLAQKGHHQATALLGEELAYNQAAHPVIREKIVMVTAEMGDPSIVHSYLKVLARVDEDVDLKIQVLEALLQIEELKKYWKEHAFAQHHLLKLLRRDFEESTHRHLRKLIIMNIFRHLPVDQVVPFFLELLEHEDEELKAVGLRSAGEIFTDPELVYYLREYLDHPNPKVRGYALVATWEFEKPVRLEPVLDALLDSDNPREIIAGLYTIGEVKDFSRQIKAQVLLDHKSDEVHLHAVIALAKLGNTDCIPCLMDLLFNENGDIAQKTFFMLKRAPAIMEIIKREIQIEVSARVGEVLIAENCTHPTDLKSVHDDLRHYLKRLYRLAERYDDLLWLEGLAR